MSCVPWPTHFSQVILKQVYCSQNLQNLRLAFYINAYTCNPFCYTQNPFPEPTGQERNRHDRHCEDLIHWNEVGYSRQQILNVPSAVRVTDSDNTPEQKCWLDSKWENKIGNGSTSRDSRTSHEKKHLIRLWMVIECTKPTIDYTFQNTSTSHESNFFWEKRSHQILSDRRSRRTTYWIDVLWQSNFLREIHKYFLPIRYPPPPPQKAFYWFLLWVPCPILGCPGQRERWFIQGIVHSSMRSAYSCIRNVCFRSHTNLQKFQLLKR